MIQEYKDDNILEELYSPLPDWVVEYIIDIIDEARSYFLTSSVGHRKEK